MAWEFSEHLRVEKNDFTETYIAWVSVFDPETGAKESLRLKYNHRPTQEEVLASLTPVVESKNAPPPEPPPRLDEVVIANGPPVIKPTDGRYYLDQTTFDLYICKDGVW